MSHFHRVHRVSRIFAALAIPAAATLAFACDRAPSADGLKEWKAADHGGERKTLTNQAPKGDGGGPEALVDLTWRGQCVLCHGATGHGDGPQGVMYHAADLSKEDWQAKVNDEEIAAAIRNGKGRMPKFELSDEVVTGLVARVRSFRGN